MSGEREQRTAADVSLLSDYVDELDLIEQRLPKPNA